MKKLGIVSSIVLTFLMVFVLSFNVMAASDDVTSVESGFSDVEFSDGFRGFCIDSSLSGAYNGDNFTPSANTSIATNNSDGSDISQYLKILFTQHFNELFVSDGNGGYAIDSAIADSTLQTVIWHFSDGRYIWGASKTLVNEVKAYNGPEIPDSGYTLELDNGDVIVFYFTVMQPQKEGQQHFFAYKIEVNPTSSHVHTPGTDWVTDDDSHWHECDCGEPMDSDSHTGGTADCKNPAKCEVCNKTYGDVDPDNHTGETEVIGYKPATTEEPGYTGDIHCKDCGELIENGEEIPQIHVHTPGTDWITDDDSHWHECDCGEPMDSDSHTGGTADCKNPAKCEVCNKTYGDVDPDNHTGETEVIGYKPATTEEPGYTGDIHCKDCGELIEKGEEIPQIHVHTPGTDWITDDDSHWHECDCGEPMDSDSHTGGTADCKNSAKCEVCNKTYGDVDPDNHTGETEVIGYKPATTEEPGYTGDIHCKDCGELIENGEEIPKIHVHTPGTDWITDDDSHWHECDCGEPMDSDSHTGGTADCVNPAKCEVCNKTYGDVDPDNHTGETEVIGYKPATTDEPGYTGDIHCKDCGELIENGEEIPVIIDDNNGNDDNTDDDITDGGITDDDITDGDGTDDDVDDNKDTSVEDTQDKDSTTNKNDSDKNDSNSVPKTGDNFTIVLWVAILLMSGACLSYVTFYKRRFARIK